ncbi:hypothetical protein M1L58_13740 [Gordonia sp. C13]|nr:hypothetical protein [Gordonia sp. C13]MCK8614913.1 hypothetical protein [Gordonia sp. C13]
MNATRHEVIPVAGGCVLSFGAPVWAAAYLPVLAIALPRIERIASGVDTYGGRDTVSIV